MFTERIKPIILLPRGRHCHQPRTIQDDDFETLQLSVQLLSLSIVLLKCFNLRYYTLIHQLYRENVTYSKREFKGFITVTEQTSL